MTTIIAHRGASGYLPEHTLAAKVLAFAQGADYLEQDVVLTQDHVPIVLHDIHLDTVTDVASLFPNRRREDGRWYAIDFTLAEIRQLSVHERTKPGTAEPVFPGRFPVGRSRFHVPTLAEEIELVQGLALSTGRVAGIYPELKAPAWHRQQGADLARVVLDLLRSYGYTQRTDRIRVQCFEMSETRRLREELGSDLTLVQLLDKAPWSDLVLPGHETQLDQMLTQVAEYADGIGPPLPMVVSKYGPDRDSKLTPLVAAAKRHGLFVDTWTLRKDELPQGVRDFAHLLHVLCEHAAVDGVFTDFPDISRY